MTREKQEEETKKRFSCIQANISIFGGFAGLEKANLCCPHSFKHA